MIRWLIRLLNSGTLSRAQNGVLLIARKIMSIFFKMQERFYVRVRKTFLKTFVSVNICFKCCVRHLKTMKWEKTAKTAKVVAEEMVWAIAQAKKIFADEAQIE